MVPGTILWCRSCRGAARNAIDLRKKVQEGFVVVSVDLSVAQLGQILRSRFVLEGMTMTRRHDDGAGADRDVVSDTGEEEKYETDPLGRFERASAFILGLAGVGGGGVAVFSTGNQAGSAALLLIGAAFLLMGIQGTPLIRLGTSESGVELARRRRRIAKVIEQAKQEEDPGVAAGIVEAAAIIEPRLTNSPSFRGRLYDSRVALALQEAGFAVSQLSLDFGPDLIVRSTDGRMAEVDVRYLGGRHVTMREVRRVESYAARKSLGTLLVTNLPLSPEVAAYNSDPNRQAIEIVQWRDEQDSPLLVRALIRVMAAGSHESEVETPST